MDGSLRGVIATSEIFGVEAVGSVCFGELDGATNAMILTKLTDNSNINATKLMAKNPWGV